jgi:outer membrane receptor protein involved in Fe transport
MAEVAFGAEVRRDRGDSINQRWPSGSPGPNYTFNQDLNLVTGGLFAQGQYKPFDKLKLLGGFRFDGVRHDIKTVSFLMLR